MNCGIYKHYKGGFYQVLGIAEHTETGEAMVVYVSLDANRSGPRLRVRPLDGPAGFNTPVQPGISVADSKRARFQYVGDSIP
jgi:hypothetical protein